MFDSDMNYFVAIFNNMAVSSFGILHVSLCNNKSRLNVVNVKIFVFISTLRGVRI
jgi:hypothetical protein